MSFLPSDWVGNEICLNYFVDDHHFDHILKRNPGPHSLSDGAHGVSAKKILVWLSQASGILATWISQSFICHTYIIIAPGCMLSWLFFFCHCPTNAAQSSQSSAEILKIEMCKYWGSNFLGAIPPFTNERNRIMEQPYLGFRAQARNYFWILAYGLKHFWLRVGTIFKHCAGVLYLKFVKQLVWWSSTRGLVG